MIGKRECANHDALRQSRRSQPLRYWEEYPSKYRKVKKVQQYHRDDDIGDSCLMNGVLAIDIDYDSTVTRAA